MLLLWASNYSQDLAQLIVLSIFSYFEEYVRGAIKEIYNRQGGPEAFIRLTEKRMTRYWDSPPSQLAEAKAKLQGISKKKEIQKAKKYSKVLVDAGFPFPPDLLAVYGARKLAEKVGPDPRKAFRAWEIPDLLSEALLLDVSNAEKVLYRDLRVLRNDLTHSLSGASMSVHEAVKKTNGLRKWAARIDAHIAEQFLVLAEYTI
jgi:hypothetical protein